MLLSSYVADWTLEKLRYMKTREEHMKNSLKAAHPTGQRRQTASRFSCRRFIDRLRGSIVEFDLTPYLPFLTEINDRGCRLRKAPDQELKNLSMTLTSCARNGADLDNLLVEAFALVREASQRVLGLRPFDVQILAGAVIHQGKLAEMQTGEGKTLAAVLPAYLNALSGKGVHLLTFNDYLARRDAGWMGPIYRFLGLNVGFVQDGMERCERRSAYQADVTYLTAKEAGFDYLRDSLCLETEDLVQPAFHFAIVDEADSILIDEARIPLVIAGATNRPEIDMYRFAEIARALQKNVDFEMDEYARNVSLTEKGIDRTQALLGYGDLYAPENLSLLTQLNLALHAAVLLRRDIDYIVRDGKVELVDELTGRVVEDRHWPDGLQAALEAKEHLPLQPEGKVLNSITLQHFMEFYPRLAGMTATAQSAADELEEFYGLKVVVIPPNRPCIRVDHSDQVFTHKEAKTKALIEEIQLVHASGRPILVGTSSVEESAHLATLLQERGITCQVLNAKTDELEARIVAQAGSLGAVTISTNMAGRGTDIRLGGNREGEKQRVTDLGGLYVVGTQRHESLRIDNQLRGRAGRQGDPGSSRFFISLEDDLIARYGVQKLILPKDLPSRQEAQLGNPVIRFEIARAQRVVEGQHFEIRKTLWKYSSLVEAQRRILCQRRREALMEPSFLRLLESRSEERYLKFVSMVGKSVLEKVEKQIMLFHIDQHWADHLAEIAQIREGIHLVRLNGQNPLEVFQKKVNEAFSDLLNRIDAQTLQSFNSVEISENDIDLEKEGLKGPSSTWTYLINDNPFKNTLELLLMGSIGFAAASASFLPSQVLLTVWAIYRQYRLRRLRQIGRKEPDSTPSTGRNS